MALTDATQQAIRAVGDVAAAHARPVEVAEPDGGGGIAPSRGGVLVVLGGVPEIRVELSADLADTVTIDETVDIEVPRRDTAAVVDTLLAGRARTRIGVGNWLTRLLGLFARNPLSAVLLVPVREGADATVYEVGLPVTLSSWLGSVPAES
jgi:hypothetical protein